MGLIVDLVVSIGGAIINAVVDAVKTIWNEVVVPLLEEVFSWFGITDETVVDAKKISTKVFGQNNDDVVQKAKIRAIMMSLKTDMSLWKHVQFELGVTNGNMRSYYLYAENGHYVHGLPSMSVGGENMDQSGIKTSLDTEKGIDGVVTYMSSIYPSPEELFKELLQLAPTLYKPGLDTMTYDSEWGVSFSDWSWKSLAYITGTNSYDITISRTAERTFFWVAGPADATEGSSLTLAVNCNRPVPAGASVTVNLIYGGSLPGTEYSAPASVTISENQTSAEFVVTLSEDAISEAVQNLIVGVDSITNTNGAFELVEPYVNDSVDVSIYDNEALALTMNSVMEDDLATSITIPVTLTQDATLAVKSTETFVGGTDYNNPAPDSSITLATTPEQSSYLKIEFDGVEETNWTLSGNVVTFGVPIPETVLQIDALISDRAFTVDFVTADGTAIGGVDYDNTGGTLVFSGDSGEVQNIVISCTPDVVAGTIEDFTVSLANCTDVAIDVSRVVTVTFSDTAVEPGPTPDTKSYDRVINKPQFTDERCLVVKYYESGGDPNDWYYWIYRYSSGLYPIEPSSAVINELDMMPVAILRKNKTNVNSNKESAEYKTTKQLLNKIQLNIDDTIAGINDNESIDQIDDVFVNFSVAPNDTKHEVSKLLYLIFYEIIQVRGILSNSGKYTALFEEQDVNNGIVWTKHSYEADIAGTITDVGKYVHSSVTGSTSRLTLRYQKTETTYDKIYIENLSGMSSIAYGGYSQVAFNALGDDEFTIPISWYVFKEMEKEEMMRIYQDIFRLDIYAISITHLEWYQTEAFRNFFEFIMIVTAVVSIIATFGTASSFWAGAWALAKQFIVSYVVMEIVVYIAEVTGSAEFAAIVGIIAAVVLMDVAALPPMDIGTADGLLTLVTQFSDNLDTAYGVEAEQMKEEIDELIAEFEEVKETFKDAPGGPLIEPEFYAGLMSLDSTLHLAGPIQYDFDAKLTGSYDRLVTDFHETMLTLGVV